MLKIRRRDPLEFFLKKSDDVEIYSGERENKCFNRNYREFFKNPTLNSVISKADLIYVDPLYSSLHYSRFYHIPETLILYDYPAMKYKGQYRDDRHQSRFSKKSTAEQEFDYVVKNCSELDVNLAINYKSKDF